MTLISRILDYNREFVERKDYEAYRTDNLPNQKLCIVSCMDTRLTELLPRALNIHNGDVKLIKNAGAIVSHPFGSVMRSILVAIYELGVTEVAIIGHHGCGMTGLSCARILEKATVAGISPDVITSLRRAGIDLQSWLTGFDKVEDGVLKSVDTVRFHPLLPKGIPVHGMVIDPTTGKLDLLEDGYTA